jgi:imidazolonepropionase-like amidohydrolase
MRWIVLSLLVGFQASPRAKALAIRDATVVVAPLITLERASIVVRDGLIVEVGTDAEIPPDAEILEGKGLTVYPGFIDGRSTLGLPADTKRPPEALRLAEGEKPDFTRVAPPSMEQANRKGIRPEFDTPAALNLTEAEVKKAHEGGFTVAVVAPVDELLSGRPAIVSLSAAPRRNALLAGSPAMIGSLHTYGEGYPGTAMGVMAHFRQLFRDAQHDHRIRESWKPGDPRPPVDPALEALQPVLRGEIPLFMEANTDREILRAIQLSQEFGFKLGITGGSEAWRVTDELHARNIPVVLSLKLPKEPKKKDPEEEPGKLRTERERLRNEEIDNALRLHQGKVHFAFSAHGLATPSESLRALQVRIEHGLPGDAAVAALTTSPARLFGLHATHGTIGRGKAGNLTVLTAPIGDPKARVKAVIVDGRKFEIEVKPPAEEKKPEEKPPAPKAGPLADRDIETDLDRRPRLKSGGTLLLRNATILTGTDLGRVAGAVLLKDGKIAAFGENVEAPEGIETIDATGLWIMPGIIDCHSHIATEGGLNEGTQSVTPEVRVRDVLNPRDLAVYRALAGGVTSANVLHGSANPIGGQNATIKLKFGEPPDRLPFPGAPLGVKFALGENPKQSNFGGNRGKRFPNTRLGVEATFRRAFTEAQEYAEAKKRNPLLRPDLRLEALLGILSGDILVHCHCYRTDEILMILQVAKDFGFQIRTLQHVLEGYRVAPEIARAGTGASTFSDWWSYKAEAFEAIPFNAALMTRAGVLVSINSDSDEQIRHLNIEAAKTIKYGGLSEKEALATVTANPARQLAIEKRAGSIEVGKDGDLAIYNGHPFSPYSRCVMTIIDGEVRFDKRDVPNRTTRGFKVEDRVRRAPGALPKGGTIAIQDAEIHPVLLNPFRGTIVFSEGKITAMGPGVRPPKSAEVIDGSGLFVYPGLIDAHTHLGLSEIGSVAGMHDDQEIGGIQPDLRALAAVNPHSELIPVTRANGITTVLTAPQGGLIAGQSAVIHLDGWVPGEMALREVYALHVIWPALDGTEEKKADDEKKMKELREPFEAARRHRPGDRDPKIEAMLPYLRGERPVVFEANRAKEIRGAIAFAEEFGLKPVLSGGREAWKVAPMLAEKKVPVLIGAVMEIPYEPHDPYDAVFANPARLAEAGVKFAISSAESFAGNLRNTPYHAAWASAYGLDRDLALRSVTLHPAQILGLADRIGALAVGMEADLIVTTGDPLEVLTDVVYEFIGGRAVSLETKHTRSYEKFKARPK